MSTVTKMPELDGECPAHDREVVEMTITTINGSVTNQFLRFECGCSASADYLGNPEGWRVTETAVHKMNPSRERDFWETIR